MQLIGHLLFRKNTPVGFVTTRRWNLKVRIPGTGARPYATLRPIIGRLNGTCRSSIFKSTLRYACKLG